MGERIKLFLEWAKVIGIAAIVVLLVYRGSPDFAANSSAPENPRADAMSIASGKAGDDRARADVLRILEQPIREVFKFPESVNIKELKVSSVEVFKEAGLKPTNKDDKIESWRICGTYSAPTPLGLYGANEPFYIRGLVDYAGHSINGDVFFKSEGEWKHISGIRNSISFKAKYEDIKNGGIEYCDDVGALDMGTLKGFERLDFGFSNSFNIEHRIREMHDDKPMITYINSCMAKGDRYGDCSRYYECIVNDKEQKCKEEAAECAEGDTVKACVEKMRAFLIKKNKKS